MGHLTSATGLAIAVLLALTGCQDAAPTAEPAETTSPATPEASQTSDTSRAVDNEPCEPLTDMPRGRIAFTHTRADGSSAVYLMKPDGTDRRCLVDTAGPDSFPAWSPDGRWLVFIGGSAAQTDIYTIRADGTHLRQLTNTKAYVEEGPVWSPDGKRIAYSSSKGDLPPFAVRVMAADGAGDKAVISSGPKLEYVDLKTWTPTGDGLLVGADAGTGISIWSLDLDSGSRQLLHSGYGDFGAGAVYSPDGKALVFQADLNGGCIYRSDATFKHLVRLTQGCIEGFDLTWSPDGNWIAWAGGAHGPADAEVMASDGTQRHTIVDSGDVAFVDWQPKVAE